MGKRIEVIPWKPSKPAQEVRIISGAPRKIVFEDDMNLITHSATAADILAHQRALNAERQRRYRAKKAGKK